MKDGDVTFQCARSMKVIGGVDYLVTDVVMG